MGIFNKILNFCETACLKIFDMMLESKIIFYNGTILTMDSAATTAEAVLIKNGKIDKIGSNKEILHCKTLMTKVIDLKNNTMLPGFIDSHTHPDVSAFMYDFVDLSGFKHKTNAEVWKHLEDSISKYSPGEWILCKGLDHMLIGDLKMPTIGYLDKIAPNNPLVIVTQMLHSFWVNTKAFDTANINKNTQDPSNASYYEKDMDGNLTGLVVEQDAFNPIRNIFSKSLKPTRIAQNTKLVMNDYLRNGNTTIVTAGLTINNNFLLNLYKNIGNNCSIVFKIVKWIGTKICGSRVSSDVYPRHFLYIDHISDKFLPSKNCNTNNDLFKILGVKMWYDGSPYVGSMYMKSHYENNEFTKDLHIQCDTTNKRLVEKDKMFECVNKFTKNGWKMLIHTQGDNAIEEVIDVFEKVNAIEEVGHLRHRLEHCMLLKPDLIVRMKELNVTPSFHINHIYYYGESLQKIIGEEQTKSILPIKTTENYGLQYSLHADQPMFESNPLSLITTAINRKTQHGMIIGESECISPLQALKSMTIMAAWQIGMDHKIGSIEPGKYADVIILEENPLHVNPENIRNIKILGAMVGGNIKFLNVPT